MMKRIGIFATIIAINFMYLTPRASAASLFGDIFGIGEITTNALGNVITYAINLVIGGIAKLLIGAAIVLVDWSIKINQTLVDPNSFANFGWGITLNIAYFLIVIGIIVIAFGTMLRQNWGLKLLPTLIIIALLINLSYFIATELITIANNITMVFLDAANASMQWTTFANFFANNIKLVNGANIGGAAGGAAANAFSPILAIAFTFIATLTLLAVAVTFYIRYIYLTILLILLPVALALSVLPVKIGRTDAWQEWKDEFFKWLLFGPVMAFFIYLAFKLLTYSPATTPGGFEMTFGVDMGKNLAVIGILLGGLFMAKSFGIAGAGIMQAGVNFVGNRAQQWAQRKGKNASDKAEQLRKLGKGYRLKAMGAELTASIYNGPIGITSGTQKFKEVIPSTWGGSADDMQKPVSISTKAKDESWSDIKINEKIKGLAKKPDNQDYADLVAYALKEGKLENPKDYLTANIKENLDKFGREKVYENLEKAAVGTMESFEQMKTSIDDAAKTIKENVFDKAKIDKDFGKNVGITSVFRGGDVAHQEAVVKALVMSSPETISATIKSIAPKDKMKFINAFENAYLDYSYQGKTDPRMDKFTGTPGYKKLFQ